MVKKSENSISRVQKWYIPILALLFLFLVCSAEAQISTDDHNLAVDLIFEADTLIRNQQYEQAIENLTKSIALDSVIRDQYIMLTRACFYSKELATAKKYLQKAKLIFLEDDELSYYLGKVYENEMNIQMALAEYDSAIKWSMQNGSDYPIVYDYYASRGNCYLQLGQYEKALDDLDKALAFNDQKASIVMRRGVALYHLNKKNEACNAWEKALEMGMQQADIYLSQRCK